MDRQSMCLGLDSRQARVAHRVERMPCKHLVGGSSPPPSSMWVEPEWDAARWYWFRFEAWHNWPMHEC